MELQISFKIFRSTRSLKLALETTLSSLKISTVCTIFQMLFLAPRDKSHSYSLSKKLHSQQTLLPSSTTDQIQRTSDHGMLSPHWDFHNPTSTAKAQRTSLKSVRKEWKSQDQDPVAG